MNTTTTAFQKVIFLLFLLTTCSFSTTYAQRTVYKKGTLVSNQNEKIDGYIALQNDKTIYFKPFLDSKTIKYRPADLSSFTYGTVVFQSYQSLFLRQLTNDGEIALYQRTFSDKNTSKYFLKYQNQFHPLHPNTYLDDLKKRLPNNPFFQKYTLSTLSIAYQYNRTDLTELFNTCNQAASNQELTTAAFFDFTETDSSRLDILGFGLNQLNAPPTNSRYNRLPNTVRDDLPLKAEKIYSEMLLAVGLPNWDKVGNALQIIEPLALEIDIQAQKSFFPKLEANLSLKNQLAFKKNLVQMIAAGIECLIQSSLKEKNIELRKLLVRQAFVEFLEIENILKTTYPQLSETITEQFKNVFSNVSDSNYNNDVQKIQLSLNDLKTKFK